MYSDSGELLSSAAGNTQDAVLQLVSDRIIALLDSGASVVEIRAYVAALLEGIATTATGVLKDAEGEGQTDQPLIVED